MSEDRPPATTTQILDRSRDAAVAVDAVSVRALPTGSRLGRFTIRHVIGRGGMGATIYEAIQDEPEQLVALKVLSADAGPRAIDRFLEEARALNKVKHPNVVRVITSGVDHEGDGAAYLAMDLVVGAVPLDVYVRDRAATLPLRRRVELMIEVCGALAEAHRIGLVHRDLKPGNVLVGADGAPKLMDFGISTAVNSEVLSAPLPTVASTPHGTPAYMAPEQARGDAGAIDARSDVYALGVMLFEMLTGKPLRQFEKKPSDPRAWVSTVLATSPPPPSKWNGKLKGDADRVVLKALESEPAKRFENAAALKEALRDLLDDARPDRSEDSPVARVARAFRRASRAMPRAASTMVVLLGSLIGWFVMMDDSLFNALGFGRVEPLLVRAAGAANTVREFSNVTMVTLDDRFDADEIRKAMKQFGLEGDPESAQVMRSLHAKLIDRLVAAGAKVIAFDIAWSVPSDADADLAAAAGRAVKSGVPVLAVAQDWDLRTGTLPALRGTFNFAGSDNGVGDGAWQLYLAVEVAPGNVQPSLAVAAWLAGQSRDCHWDLSFENSLLVKARGWIPTGEVGPQGQPLQILRETLTIVPSLLKPRSGGGLLPETLDTARMRVIIPSDGVLARSTVSYADVIAPDFNLSVLKSKFGGRIVLVGDLRKDCDPRETYFDGRLLPMYDAVAVGIETMGEKTNGLAVSWIAFTGAVLAVSCLGVVMARLAYLRFHRPLPVGITAIAFSIIAIVLASTGIAFLCAWESSLLINPGPLVVAGACAFVISLLVRRWSRLPMT